MNSGPTTGKICLANLGYRVIDPIRSLVWNDPDVEPWYAQNLLFFARELDLAKYPELAKHSIASNGLPLSVVHPKILEWQVERAAGAEHRADLMNHPSRELASAALKRMARRIRRFR
jgi:hypothetical protein